MSKPISCLNCVHYYVTWDPATPRGCRKFRFKSHIMPSIMVSKETGEKCGGFEAKPSIKQAKKELDLNDDSLW